MAGQTVKRMNSRDHTPSTPVCSLWEADAPEVFHPEQLLRRCLGKLEFAQRILERFLGVLPLELQDLENAHRSGDVVCMARTAHRLKGATANVSAHRLHSLMAEIELLSRERQTDELDELLQRAQREAALLIRSVEQWRRSSPAEAPLYSLPENCTAAGDIQQSGIM